MKNITYRIEIKEDQFGRPFFTIQRGKLGETYPINKEIYENLTTFIIKNFKAQLEIWGLQKFALGE